MPRSSKFRVLASLAGAAFFAMACQGNNTGTGSQDLAPDQTLRFSMSDDVTSLDPAHVDAAVDITYLAEVFDGLLKFDKSLKIIPDAAKALPEISSDGLTYTFHLRNDVKFSNGDKVTSKDWVYSWTRTLKINDAYSSNLEVIKGAADVENGKATTISGLSAPDDYTLVAKLTAPAGFWLSQLAMPTASEVLSQKAVQQGGEDKWWQDPATYIGTGPFKMTVRTPKAHMEFEPVANWWGGSTGSLKKIVVDIGVKDTSAVQKFEAGGYDIVGEANNSPDPDSVLRYKADPAKSKLLNIYPGGRTTAVQYNFINGPFASKPGAKPGDPTVVANDPGLKGRQAFSQAINRDAVVDQACAHGATCEKATGGPLTKGFKGYLGDGADPNSKFDASAAKALYTAWDPDGSKVKGLKYRYNTNGFNDKIATAVTAQWQQNLGVKVEQAPSDFPTLQKDRKAKNVVLGRASWGVDYDDPQDWFSNLFTCAQARLNGGNDPAFCSPDLDTAAANGDKEPDRTKSLSFYNQASKILVDNVVWANLIYGTQPFMAQSWVSGAGHNSLYDFPWEGIKILKH